jgi:hypothetical protein
MTQTLPNLLEDLEFITEVPSSRNEREAAIIIASVALNYSVEEQEVAARNVRNLATPMLGQLAGYFPTIEMDINPVDSPPKISKVPGILIVDGSANGEETIFLQPDNLYSATTFRKPNRRNREGSEMPRFSLWSSRQEASPLQWLTHGEAALRGLYIASCQARSEKLKQLGLD